jgi:hypothetical protein
MTGTGRRAVATLLVAALAGPSVLWAGTLAYDVRASAIVLDAEKVGLALTSFADDAGGYFLLRSLDTVVFRIPAARVGEVRSLLAGVTEVVLSYEPSTRDVREELAAVESALTSREEALTLILDADVAGTLALEREIAGLMGDIESFRGRKQRLENDAAFARVEVSLSSRRQTVPSQRPSSFAWVNSVDLYRFLREVLPYGR